MNSDEMQKAKPIEPGCRVAFVNMPNPSHNWFLTTVVNRVSDDKNNGWTINPRHPAMEVWHIGVTENYLIRIDDEDPDAMVEKEREKVTG